MSVLTLQEADRIAGEALGVAAGRGFKPVAICVLDVGGNPIVVKRQDGATFLRPDVARAKAWTALSLGSSSRSLANMAETRGVFVGSLVTISDGRMAPAAGGLIIVRDGEIIGAVGVSGESPDNDEVIAMEGIRACGLTWGEAP